MKFPAKKIMPRYFIVWMVVVVLGLAVLARAFHTMTVRKEFWMGVADRFVAENKPVEPTRGNILAADGQVLAASLPEYKMYMDFMSWEVKDTARRNKEQHWRDTTLYNNIKEICAGMHEIFPDITPEKFEALLRDGRQKESHHHLLYPKRITYIQYCRVKQLPLFRYSANRGGFHVETFKMRKNPFGKLATRTIGDLFTWKDSARTGLELSFDDVLRGKPGKSHRQKVLNSYLTIIDQPAVDGADVLTTLDVEMQDICEKALRDKLTEIQAKSGVCILMEVATGDIKGMTSLTRTANGTYHEINADAVKNLFEPGSVFKPMSFLVAMDDGKLSMNDGYDVGGGIREMYGAKMRDANWRSGGSGYLTVPQILQKSSNVGVSSLIDRAYHDHPEQFVDGLYRIGVAEDLKIPIPGYAKPRIRRPKPDGSNWSKTALPWMSIGYETQLPPITTVNFYNGLANNGKLLRPRLVKAILRNGIVEKEFPVEVLREQMAKPQVIADMQSCLRSVVAVGTGKKGGSKYFQVSGKTGTAQVWTKFGFSAEYLVSFVGYFPSDKPLYSCIVCIHKGAPASGGGDCAPVFRRVAETIMAQRRTDNYACIRDTLHCVNPSANAGNLAATVEVLNELKLRHSGYAPTENQPVAWGRVTTSDAGLTLAATSGMDAADRVPDVKDYGLRDALFRLEKMGLRVKHVGMGRVSKQSLKPGEPFKPGDEILLTLGHFEPPAKAAPPPAPAANPPESPDSAKKKQAPAPASAEQADKKKKPASTGEKPDSSTKGKSAPAKKKPAAAHG